MKRIITYIASLGIAAAAFAGVETGKPAPDFTATDINGKTVKLSDYKGKIVVIESYNLDCPFCANHFKTGAMQELQKEATGKGAIWLMVNSVNSKHPNARTTEAAKKEWADQKLAATAWIDDNAGTLGKQYGMKTTPEMFIVDKDGKLAYQGAIDDKADPSHNPREAKNYVKQALGEIWSGKAVSVSESKPYGCSVKYAN